MLEPKPSPAEIEAHRLRLVRSTHASNRLQQRYGLSITLSEWHNLGQAFHKLAVRQVARKDKPHLVEGWMVWKGAWVRACYTSLGPDNYISTFLPAPPPAPQLPAEEWQAAREEARRLLTEQFHAELKRLEAMRESLADARFQRDSARARIGALEGEVMKLQALLAESGLGAGWREERAFTLDRNRELSLKVESQQRHLQQLQTQVLKLEGPKAPPLEPNRPTVADLSWFKKRFSDVVKLIKEGEVQEARELALVVAGLPQTLRPGTYPGEAAIAIKAELEARALKRRLKAQAELDALFRPGDQSSTVPDKLEG